jgi:DNA-binding SARP family transcriptional activator/predicted ATPase
MGAELKITLLGTPQISLGGRTLRFVRRRAEALLVYLAISGRVHTRDALAMLLAGETDDQRARKHLRTALAEVTASLGDYLIVTPRTIAFDRTRPCWIDVAEFEAAVAAEDPEQFQAAVALHRDEFMAGFALPDAPAFDDWLLFERERLRDHLIQTLQALVAWYNQRGDCPAGIACARQLLAVEPWSEEAHRGLMQLLARGGQRGAALAQYDTCRRVLREELGIEPTPETTSLYWRLRAAPVAVRHNLPERGRQLPGRAGEVRELRARLLAPTGRLVTIVGLGGSGKTDLALSVAWSFAAPGSAVDEDIAPDGVFLVDLTDTGAAGGCLAERIGRACGLSFAEVDDPRGYLLSWLSAHGVLLVLDYGEAPPGESDLLGEILLRAPRATLLATARERLHLQGEWVRQLAGLPVPKRAELVEQSAAGQVFLQRARQLGAGAELTTMDYPAIATICQLTDGLPLALLMAADWLRALTCSELAARLAGGLELLTSTLQDLPARQRSMREILARAAARLTDDERAVLRGLAVFQGPFDQEAVRQVALATPQQLLALRDSGLLEWDEHGYRLPELVRRYAGERLSARPHESAQVHARHAAHFATLVGRRSDAIARDPHELQLLGGAIDDARAAWAWSADQVALDLLVDLRDGLARWYDLTGDYAAWASEFDRAVCSLRVALGDTLEPEADLHSVLATLLAARAQALHHLGQCEEALVLLDEGDELLDTPAATADEARLAFCRGVVLGTLGSLDAAQRQLTTALARATAAGNRGLEAASAAALGRIAITAGDHRQAQLRCEAALAHYQALGDRLGASTTSLDLGTIAAERGDIERANQLFLSALEGARAFGYRRGQFEALQALGLLACEASRDQGEAMARFGEARRIAREIGDCRGEAAVWACEGRSALRAGDFERAEASFVGTLTLDGHAIDHAGHELALRGLGLLEYYRGDARQAQLFGNQALAIARRLGLRRARQAALLLIGHARSALGDLAGAASAYGEARDPSGTGLAIDANAALAWLAFTQGDAVRATSHIATLLSALQSGQLAGVEEPVRVYLTGYRILSARRDPRAAELLVAGHALLQDHAAALDDDARQAFLNMIPANRELLCAWREYLARTPIAIDSVQSVQSLAFMAEHPAD